MALKNWRAIASRILSDEIGPTAEIMIDETLSEMNMLEGEMVASRFLVFLKKMHTKIPDTIDRNALLYNMRNEVLKQYGFNFDNK